jgi:galactokinase
VPHTFRELVMKDLEAFIETLRARELFDRGTSLIVTRAPGRLDVMGGIADYSGSLVLQRPIAEATFVALQPTDLPVIEITSTERKSYTVPLNLIAPGGEPVSYGEARKFFADAGEHQWAAYVAGIFLVLMHERQVSFTHGAKIVISSRVPEGKGVASSAALETAAMQAVASAFGIRIESQEMALLCQKTENLVVGAPCGIMDQVTCVCGDQDSLLALLCQPAELQPPVRVPEEISFWGLDSGERHSVGGSDYGSVRTGAFMGFRIITERDEGHKGCLANVSPSEFERDFLESLPEQMSGEEFLARYSSISDSVTTVDCARVYKIRRPTAHPVYEHHRVQVFRQLLLVPPSEEQRRLLGELMYQSHASYSACGLGSPGTDLIVDLVRQEGPAGGLYGARVTGGGCGGTVAILGESDASQAIAKIAESYQHITRYRPYIFSGSSPGVATFGSLALTL